MPRKRPMYPHVAVALAGIGGGTAAIIARVQDALRTARVPDDLIQEFATDAMSGDYNHLLETVMYWVNTV